MRPAQSPQNPKKKPRSLDRGFFIHMIIHRFEFSNQKVEIEAVGRSIIDTVISHSGGDVMRSIYWSLKR